MGKAKIILLALLALVAGAVIFVFRYKSEKNEEMNKKMAEVRSMRGLKKDLSTVEEKQNEEAQTITG